VTEFYKEFYHWNSRRISNLYDKALLSNLLIDVKRGVGSARSLFEEACRQIEFPCPDKATEEVCANILSNCAVETFAQSNPENNPKSPSGVPLGALAEELVIRYTG